MSRRLMPFGGPCHNGEEWTCAGCERIQCQRCDGIDNGSGLCWSCHEQEDDGDAA